jgi:shikimate kinase
MGAGKTTIGRLLAERVGRPFRDSDETLERTGGRTAAELYATAGSDAVHDREAAILLDQLADDEPSVIAAAASVVESEPVVEALAGPDVAVTWLHAEPEVLVERARGGAHRPWHGQDPLTWLRERAAVRDPLYARLADDDIDVSDLGPEAAAATIARRLDLARSS